MKSNHKALLALVMTGTMILTNVSMVLADTKTEILDARQEIKNITHEIKSGEEKISRLDNDLIELSVQIEDNKIKHTQILEDIRITGGEIAIKVQQRDAKQAQLGKRLRSSYKSGDVSWIKALIDSNDLSDFLLRTKVLKEITRQDQTVISELDAIKADLEATQTELTRQEQEVTDLLVELDAQEKELHTSLADQQQNVAQVTSKKAELAALVAGKEIELFAEIRDVLTDQDSTIMEITEARTLLAQLEEFIETEEAERLASQLDETSSEILADLEAEAAAREAARQAAAREAERRAAQEAARVAAREAQAKAEAKRAEAERQAQAEEARRLRAAQTTPVQTKPATKPSTTPVPIPTTVPAPAPAPKLTPAQVAPAKPVVSSNLGTGARALAEAKTYLGVPYVYGGASYSGVDCSGFTMRAYAQAGVSLPRTATAQYRASRRISRSDLQPGDLIFWGFGGEITHVAMYVGNGMQIHAPRPGKSVCIVKMFGGMDYIGAGRPY